MNLGSSMAGEAGNMTALASLMQGGQAGAFDVKAMMQLMQMMGVLGTVVQGTRAVANAIAPTATVPHAPEPVNVPAPLNVVPEPEPTPVPEIVPIMVAAPVSPVATLMSPISAPVSPVAEAEEEVKYDDEPVYEPLRKRFRVRQEVEEEVKDTRVGSMIQRPAPPGNFDTFERKTMNFNECVDHFKPKKTFNLPTAIVMTRHECESKIREYECQYKQPLTQQAIRGLRTTKATGPARIKMLQLEISEIERDMRVSEELEELLTHCETLRKLASSRSVKNCVANEARFRDA